MTDQDQNFITEMLRKIQSDVALIRREHGDRLSRIELRLSTIEQTLGNLYALSGSDRESMADLARRIERIERRLELNDENH